MNVGEKIFELRKSKNISQEELGNILNVSRQTISKWETNETTPEISKLVGLCDYFDISIDDLLKGNLVPKVSFIQRIGLASLSVIIFTVFLIVAIVFSVDSLSDIVISCTSILAISAIVILIINSCRRGIRKGFKNDFRVSVLSKIVLIIVYTVLLLGLVGMVLFFCFNATSKAELLINKEYKDVNQLNVDLMGSDVSLLESNNDKIMIKVYGSSKDKDFFDIDYVNKDITIREDYSFQLFYVNSPRVLIYLPKDYNTDLKIKTSSGNLDSEIVASGNFSTNSGDFKFGTLMSSEIKSTSGEINIENAIHSLKVNCTSGDVNIGNITGYAFVDTTSGSVNIDDLVIDKDSYIKSSSGDVFVDKFSGGIIYAETKSGSQDVGKFFGKYVLNVKTTSGDIKVG